MPSKSRRILSERNTDLLPMSAWPSARQTQVGPGCPFSSVCFPPSHQWNKGYGHQASHLEVMWSFVTFGHQHERLSLEGIAHRNHHPSARLQLLDQRGRDVVSSCSHDDAVKGSLLGPTKVAISYTHLNILIAESLQSPTCGRAQWLDDFDGINLCDQPRKDCSLIA